MVMGGNTFNFRSPNRKLVIGRYFSLVGHLRYNANFPNPSMGCEGMGNSSGEKNGVS